MERVSDMEVEIPLPDGSLAPEGGGEPMDLDMILDRVKVQTRHHNNKQISGKGGHPCLMPED